MTTRVAALGNLGAVWEEMAKRGDGSSLQGSGTDLEERDALVPALAEALERYSAATPRTEQFIWATAKELGRDALDLESLPRCSPAELSHPKCPLIVPDRNARIRWVRGFSLLDGTLVWLPVVMVYTHPGYASPGERFWLSISTGCAAQTCLERAILTGIYELIERDAISITWLQKLALPRIEIDRLPAALAPYWERILAVSQDVEHLFFDATSDLGIPTVYGLQLARHNRRAATLVGCSTHSSAAVALSKVIRDLAACRIAFRKPRAAPDHPDDFVDLHHGATYMARAEHFQAFEFLTQSCARRKLSMICDRPRDSVSLLKDLVEIFRIKQWPVYVADLSTDEALRAGMRVVRVIIPNVQPLSVRPRAQYRAHPRLYTAPAEMGYPVRSEQDLNAWPQPFA